MLLCAPRAPPRARVRLSRQGRRLAQGGRGFLARARRARPHATQSPPHATRDEGWQTATCAHSRYITQCMPLVWDGRRSARYAQGGVVMPSTAWHKVCCSILNRVQCLLLPRKSFLTLESQMPPHSGHRYVSCSISGWSHATFMLYTAEQTTYTFEAAHCLLHNGRSSWTAPCLAHEPSTFRAGLPDAGPPRRPSSSTRDIGHPRQTLPFIHLNQPSNQVLPPGGVMSPSFASRVSDGTRPPVG